MRISDWSSDVCSSDLLAVTGAKVRTTFTPDLPAVSDLQLDMGIRIPVLRDWPGNKPVNGQAAYTSHVVELPVRNDDGSLRIVPRSEERRAGKGCVSTCRSRWSPCHSKKKKSKN